MAVLRTVLTIILILVSIVFTAIVLMQEGKSAGLSGAISGAAETYWGKNKGRSMEGTLVKLTKVLGVVFILLSVVLNINF